MQYLLRLSAAALIILLASACNHQTPVSADHSEDTQTVLAKKKERAPLTAFQTAGPAGARGVLTEGATFPPTNGGTSKLERDDDELSYKIETTGLPPGAYTAWWIIFNNPAGCFSQCGAADFANPAARASVFWATGGIVQQDGIGKFEAEIREGEPSKGPDGFLIGSGLDDATNAEVHIAIKYHGPASSDPNVLFQQLNTLLGGCSSGANANANGQCFDPQAAVHRN